MVAESVRAGIEAVRSQVGEREMIPRHLIIGSRPCWPWHGNEPLRLADARPGHAGRTARRLCPSGSSAIARAHRTGHTLRRLRRPWRPASAGGQHSRCRQDARSGPRNCCERCSGCIWTRLRPTLCARGARCATCISWIPGWL
jgi:hypothetical protein